MKNKLHELLKSENAKVSFAAARILEHKKFWNEIIAEKFVQGYLNEAFSYRRNEYFEKLKGKKLPRSAFEILLLELGFKRSCYDAEWLLANVDLDQFEIQKLRDSQKSSSITVKVLSALVLARKEIPDSETKKVLSFEGVEIVHTDLLLTILKKMNLGPEELNLLASKMFDADSKIRESAREVFFKLEKLNSPMVKKLRFLLKSDDSWIRISAANMLLKKGSTPEIEVALIEGMISRNEWNNEYFFSKLEGNLNLSKEAQVFLAKNLIENVPTSDNYVVRLLRNQISLNPEAEKVLASEPSNPFAKEILASKKTSCEGTLLNPTQ